VRLFTFPSNLDPEILAIGAGHSPYARTPGFSRMMMENEQMLLELIGCPNGRVVFLTASGTGAMDAVMANLPIRYGKVLVVNGGTFGDRWRQLCDYYGIPADVCDVEFGQDADYAHVEAALAAEDYDALLVQHHETSSGQLFDVARFGSACSRRGTLLVVDAIGSFLADPYSMSGTGTGVAVVSSHKGLCLPPGMSFVVLNEDAAAGPFETRSFYFDFKTNLANLERGQTPFTPAGTILVQLHRRLEMTVASGVAARLDAVRNKAEHFRELAAARGYRLSASLPSNCLTGLHVDADAPGLCTHLEREGMYVMPGGGPDLIRVSHTGALELGDFTALMDAIDHWRGPRPAG
jgi:aspartate aminotransferase-like enzyme